MKYRLSPNIVAAIERALESEDRVEIIPGKDGKVKIIHIKRQEIKVASL